MRFLRKIRENFSSPRANQIGVLYASNIFAIPIGIVTSIIVTNFLGADAYGDFQFIRNILLISVTLFSLGLFQSGNRALVLNKNNTNGKEIYGTILIFGSIIYLAILVVLFIYGNFDNNIHEKGLRSVFLGIIPFSFLFLLVNFFEVLLPADNKIRLLAFTRLTPKFGYLLASLFALYFLSNNEVNRLLVIWACLLFPRLIVYLYALKKIRPLFRNLKQNSIQILQYNKEFGFHVYIGSVLSVGLSTLTGILISYFGIDNTGVGYFSLSLTFAAPLALIPNVVATTFYKDFSGHKRISGKLIGITLILTLIGLIASWLVVGPFIKFFYNEEFLPVIRLFFIVSIGTSIHGLADFFNRFLGAQGQGKYLRNSAIIVGVVLLLSNLILIPKFGEHGAAFTKLISAIVYCISIIYFYKKHISRKQSFV